MKHYKEIFDKLEIALRNHSNLSKTDFDLEFGWFKNLTYKNLTDNEIYWTLVYVTFYSGMRASTVGQKLPAIKKYLYDFKNVKDYSREEIRRILDDPGTIHHKQKIEACIANAKEFDNILKKYGSFTKYIESFSDSQGTGNVTIDKLRMDLRSRFQYLGERTVNHFLTDLGFNVLKPDRVICRIFTRLGLIDNENSIDQAIKVGKDIASATGFPIRYVDIIFVTYGQMGERGICLLKNPKCSICGVQEYCKYYADNYR